MPVRSEGFVTDVRCRTGNVKLIDDIFAARDAERWMCRPGPTDRAEAIPPVRWPAPRVRKYVLYADYFPSPPRQGRTS
jgi:hypothetical protein